jgi:hypothetical protein
MAHALVLREDPVEYEGVLHLFNTRIEDVDPFLNKVIPVELYPGELIGWNTHGPIDHHLGKCNRYTDSMLRVGYYWEMAMRCLGADWTSLVRVHQYITHVLGAASIRFEDVAQYHHNHTDEYGWYTEQEHNDMLALQYAQEWL